MGVTCPPRALCIHPFSPPHFTYLHHCPSTSSPSMTSGFGGLCQSYGATRKCTMVRPHTGMSSLRMGVEPEDVSGKRLWVKFSAFGFGGRTCQLELRDSGDCIFSKGMVTVQPGAWRIEEEQGQDYLQFTCPLTELYSEIFDIPSS
ncbi:unnamed protein product, partial [Choristocarpus tenellus]